jgi:hypothetical protein
MEARHSLLSTNMFSFVGYQVRGEDETNISKDRDRKKKLEMRLEKGWEEARDDTAGDIIFWKL